MKSFWKFISFLIVAWGGFLPCLVSSQKLISCEKWGVTTDQPQDINIPSSATPLDYTVMIWPSIPDTYPSNIRDFNVPFEVEARIRVNILTNDTTSLFFYIEDSNGYSKISEICSDGVKLTDDTTSKNPVQISSVTTFEDSYKNNIVQVNLEKGVDAGTILQLTIPYKFSRSINVFYNNVKNTLAAYLTGEFLPRFVSRTKAGIDREPPKTPFKVSVAKQSKAYDLLVNSAQSLGIEDGNPVWENFETTAPLAPKELQFIVLKGLEKYTSQGVDIPTGLPITTSVWTTAYTTDEYKQEISTQLLKYMDHLIRKWNITGDSTTHNYHIRVVPGLDARSSKFHKVGDTTIFTVGGTPDSFRDNVESRYKLYRTLAMQYLHFDGMEEGLSNGEMRNSLPFGLVDYANGDALSKVDPYFFNENYQELLEYQQYLWSAWVDGKNVDPFRKGAVFVKFLEGLVTKPVLETAIHAFYRNLSPNLSADQRTQIFYLAIQKSLEANKVKALLPPIKISLSEYMNTWLDSDIAPTIVFRSVKDHPTSIMISQESPKDPRRPELRASQRKWIPIAVSGENFQKGEQLSGWLHPNGNLVSSKLINTRENWTMADMGKTDPRYRALYDKELTSLINEQLERDHLKIPIVKRIQYISNYLQLFTYNRITLDNVFETMAYLDKEYEELVWKAALFLIDIRRQKNNILNTNDLKVKYTELLDRGFKRFGATAPELEQDAGTSKWLQKLFTECEHVPYPSCIEYSSELGVKLAESPDSFKKIPSDRYCLMVRYGSWSTWEILFDKAKEEAAAVRDNRGPFLWNLVNSLACTTNPELLVNLLNETISYSSSSSYGVTLYDPITVSSMILSQYPDSDVASDVVYYFLKRNLLSGHLPSKDFYGGMTKINQKLHGVWSPTLKKDLQALIASEQHGVLKPVVTFLRALFALK